MESLHFELEALTLLKVGRPAMAYLSRNLSTARMFLLNRLGYTSQYRMGINFPNGKIFFVTKIRTVTKKIRYKVQYKLWAKEVYTPNGYVW